jgi:hypothetical protein
MLEPAKSYDHRTDGIVAASHITRHQLKTAAIPVVKGPRGLCYDVGKVADEGRRKKLLANRASAKSSRQRRLDEARGVRAELARLEDENNSLREANVTLKRRIMEVCAHLTSSAANTGITSAGKFGMHHPTHSWPVTVASLLNALQQSAPASGIVRPLATPHCVPSRLHISIKEQGSGNK